MGKWGTRIPTSHSWYVQYERKTTHRRRDVLRDHLDYGYGRRLMEHFKKKLKGFGFSQDVSSRGYHIRVYVG